MPQQRELNTSLVALILEVKKIKQNEKKKTTPGQVKYFVEETILFSYKEIRMKIQ